MLEAGLVGLAAVAVAALAGTLGASIFGRTRTAASGSSRRHRHGRGCRTPTPPPTAASTAPDAAAGGAGGTTATGSTGPVIAKVSQLASGRAVTFDDPGTGDPGVLVKLADGTFVAFDAVCTHAGCTVGVRPWLVRCSSVLPPLRRRDDDRAIRIQRRRQQHVVGRSDASRPDGRRPRRHRLPILVARGDRHDGVAPLDRRGRRLAGTTPTGRHGGPRGTRPISPPAVSLPPCASPSRPTTPAPPSRTS